MNGWADGAAWFFIAIAATACRTGSTATHENEEHIADAQSEDPTISRFAFNTDGSTTRPGAFRIARVEIPGLSLGDFQPRSTPTPAHPRGTIVALAYPEPDSDGPLLVEIDVATKAVLHRTPLRVGSRASARMARAGSELHIGVQDGNSLLWISYDTELNERRRVALSRPAAARDPEQPFGFFASAGVAAVLAHDATISIHDTSGARVRAFDCRPLEFQGTARVNLAPAGDLVVVEELADPRGRRALCGFRIDGRGPLVERSFDEEAFVHGGGAYVVRAGNKAQRLDDRLVPFGAVLDDPRPSLDEIQRCRVTGEYALRDAVVGGVRIIASGSCCGGEPGGLFFCDASGASAQ